MDMAAAEQLVQKNLRQRFARVAHHFPDDVPLASSAGGLESYAPDEEYQDLALWLPRDGDYVLTDRTLIFIDSISAVKFPLDRMEAFEPRQRREGGPLRHVKLTMRSGQVHQLAAGATFVDEVLAALGQPNASDGLLQLKGEEQAVAKGHLLVAGTPDHLPAADRYATGDYDVLLTSTRLLGWAAQEKTLVVPLADIREWRQTRGDQVAAQLTFQDGSARTLAVASTLAETIRKTAGVRKRRLRS